MTGTGRIGSALLAAGIALAVGGWCGAAYAAGDTVDWKRFNGQTITFLSSNHPWAQAVLKRLDQFTELTGIKLRVDTFQEAQMRDRLMTVLQSRSSDVDLFMSLKSREGLLFADAGWYADLRPLVNDPKLTASSYNLADFSPALLKGEEFKGKLAGIPLNIEGPVLYIRKDVFARCKLAPPTALQQLPDVAAKLKACDPGITPFVSRGAKGALAYTFSNFLHNLGGDYFDAGGKSNLCSAPGKQAMQLYADLLKNYGPPGVVNYSFLQIREMYGQGRAAMAFESSNEFGPIMQFPGRTKDSAVALLPPGPGGVSRPTVIGWGISMSAFSQHQDPTWYFIQWATSPAMQTALALDGIAPPRVSIANSAQYQAWLAAEPVRQEWSKALDAMARTGTSEVGPPMEQQPEARDILGDEIQQMILGQVNADQACAAADKQIDALVAREQHH
jgi:multiple sugar transport system substrate-binding protein